MTRRYNRAAIDTAHRYCRDTAVTQMAALSGARLERSPYPSTVDRDEKTHGADNDDSATDEAGLDRFGMAPNHASSGAKIMNQQRMRRHGVRLEH